MSGVACENTRQCHDPMSAALMHSQTPTWLNSINPQRSLAIFALMLTLFLHLVLQRHHCVMVAYKRGWTLTGLCPQDFNHSSTTGCVCWFSAEAWECHWSDYWDSLLSLHISGLLEESYWQQLQAVGEERARQHDCWTRKRLSTLEPPLLPPSSSSVLMTNQNEKWRRGRAWKSLICSAC